MDPEPSRADWKDVTFRGARRAGSPVPVPSATEDGGEDSLPDRYRLRGEQSETLVCVEAPTLTVSIVRGAVVSASALKNARPGSIFLDGAALGPPEVDTERGVLNLDHHEGCVRPFTLATCEQAFVLVSKGLDLDSREWTIHVNDPDLDALLAIWVLLNHRRIALADPENLRPLVRLVRLEGAIDAHGLEHRHYCGFSPEDEELAFAELESLRALEVELKQSGEWSSMNLAEYVADQLRAIDRLVYEEGDFEGLAQVEEIGRTSLADGRLAIACRSDDGIYRAEQHLRAVYGDRLGLIVLAKEDGHYTLRQTGAFSRLLQRIYERLNLIDSAAGGSRSGERWGGSAEIGGSPRTRGSSLGVDQILEACAASCRPPTAGAGLSTLGVVAVITGALSFLPWAIGTLPLGSPPLARAAGALALFVVSVLGYAELARRPGIAGFRRPAGWSWLWALLPAAIGVGAAGAWLAGDPGGALGWVVLLLLPTSAELLFRGVGYGILLARFAGLEGRYRHLPWLGSSGLYALWTTVLGWTATLRPDGGGSLLEVVAAPLIALTGSDPRAASTLVVVFCASLLLGLALGYVRQRSESVLAPVAVHVALVVAAALL